MDLHKCVDIGVQTFSIGHMMGIGLKFHGVEGRKIKNQEKNIHKKV